MNINCTVHVGYGNSTVVLGHDGGSYHLSIHGNISGTNVSLLKEDLEELLIACSAILGATQHLDEWPDSSETEAQSVGKKEYFDSEWEDQNLDSEPLPAPKTIKQPKPVGKTLAEALADGSLMPKS